MEPKKISDNVTLYSADPIVYVVNNFLTDDDSVKTLCKGFDATDAKLSNSMLVVGLTSN